MSSLVIPNVNDFYASVWLAICKVINALDARAMYLRRKKLEEFSNPAMKTFVWTFRLTRVQINDYDFCHEVLIYESLSLGNEQYPVSLIWEILQRCVFN